MTSDFGINQGLVDELYASYLENPRLVNEGWRRYFETHARQAHAATNGLHARHATDPSVPLDSPPPDASPFSRG